MGVPAAFIYITPWTGGIYMTGDSRITSVVNDTSSLIKGGSYSRAAFQLF